MKKQLLGLAVIAAAIAGTAPAPAMAQMKLTMGHTFGTTQLASLVANKMGYFKQAGLDVTFKNVSRGNVALGAMATGNLQFAESAHAPFLAAVSRGVPFVAVGVVTRGFQGKLVAARKYENLKTLADFKGKHIGIQVGTGVDTVIRMLLAKEHIERSDFKFTNIRTVDMPAAMGAPNNPFAAVIGWEPNMSRIAEGGYGKIIIDAKTFEEEAGITFPFLLSTTVQFHKEHPDIVQKVVNVYAKGQQFIRQHPDQAVKIFTEAANDHGAKLTEKLVRVMLFDMQRFGGVNFSKADMVDLPATRDFLFSIGKLKTKPDLSKCLDPSFAQKAEAALTN